MFSMGFQIFEKGKLTSNVCGSNTASCDNVCLRPRDKIDHASKSGNKANIQKLNSKNYPTWRRQVTMILELRGLLPTVEEDEEVDYSIGLQAGLNL